MEEAEAELMDEVGPGLDCGCGTPGWNMAMPKFCEKLLKYRLVSHKTCHGCVLGKGVLEDYVHCVIRMSGERAGVEMAEVFLAAKKRWPRACRHGVNKYWRRRTGLLKMGGTRVTPYWREECYWELGQGYVPYKPMEDMGPEAIRWLCKDTVLGGPVGEDNYLDWFHREVEDFMRTEFKMPEHQPTIDGWVATGKWMEGKSGTGGKVGVTIDGKRKMTRRTKPLAGVLMWDAEVGMELTASSREVMHILQKSEAGKVRSVVKTGDKVNRKMNYLSGYLEDGLHGSPLSTLFAGEAGNERIDFDLIDAVRDESTWKVPLDQGAFDEKQSKMSIAVALHAVGMALEERGMNGDGCAVWAALWDSLFVRGALVEWADESRPWKNGLPSGWRWTAVLDTILNVCSFRVIRKISEIRLGKPFWVGHFYAQGDDVIFAARDLGGIRLIIDTYGKLGYEVHPYKTYISRGRGEFLRRSYEAIGVTGYLARTMHGLRFKNPIQDDPLSLTERIYSHMMQWHLAMLRGGVPEVVVQMLMEDLRGMRISTKKAAGLFLTPNCLGGGGVDPASAFGSWIEKHSDGNWYTLKVTREMRCVNVRLGGWKERLRRYDELMSGTARDALMRSFALSWGLKDADITGLHDVTFTKIKGVVPIPPTSPFLVPKVGDLWNMDDVPVQIRDAVKREAIRRGSTDRWLTVRGKEIARWAYDRMSPRVVKGFLLNEWNAPCPITDRVGTRYGVKIKRWANTMIRSALHVRNIGMRQLESHLYWIELQVREKLKLFGASQLLAQ